MLPERLRFASSPLRAGLLGALVSLIGPAWAGAATGEIDYASCITGETQAGPTGTNACAQIPGAASFGTNSGLNNPQGVTISPDGETLYAVSSGDDAIATFDRNPATGALTYAGCITGETQTGPTGTNACAQIPGAASSGINSGLDAPQAVEVSPDGESLYAAAASDDAIARFDRNPATGALTYAGCITGETQTGPTGTNACAQIPGAASSGTDSGLDSPQAVEVSPDGESLYAVAALDDAIATFDRNPATGALTYAGCITGETQTGPTGTNACAQIPGATSLGNGSGLDVLQAITISPEGESLFASSPGDDAIARFDRNPATGALTYEGCVTGETESGPTGTNACAQIPGATSSGTDSGLDAPQGVEVSPDGESLYAVAALDDAIATFDRNPATGALTYAGCITGETQTGPAGTNACAQIPGATASGINSGLDSPQAVEVSPDGESLYAVAALDDAIATFDRNPATGALTYAGCSSGKTQTGPTGTNACAQIPGATSFGTDSGLDSPQAVEVSPDGEFLYAVAASDNAVARFQRTLPPEPSLSVSDETVAEGNAGQTQVEFEVTLSNGSPNPGRVRISTRDATATAPDDYAPEVRTLKFQPGDVFESFSVGVNGDTTFELEETFLVEASDVESASIADGLGSATIQNDDQAPDPGRCRTLTPTIVGTPGDDAITGTPGNDVIISGSGDDVISGGGGDDTICAKGGEDTVNGDAGNDVLVGGAGSDAIGGGADNDQVFGSDGDDNVFGGGGLDEVRGNSGDDSVNGGTGQDTLFGSSGDDLLDGAQDADTIVGDSGDDTILGQAGNDTIRGGSGDDTADGGLDNDDLRGGGDDDSLDGGAGTDTCDGGSGQNSLTSC